MAKSQQLIARDQLRGRAALQESRKSLLFFPHILLRGYAEGCFFLVKNQPNLRAPVVRPSPDLCGIYRVLVLLYNCCGVEARRDARAERGLGFWV